MTNADFDENELRRLLHDKGERVKELRCMFRVAESIRKRGPLKHILQAVAESIPPGWHYPEITRGCVRFQDLECSSEPFEKTEWRQVSEIVVNGRPQGYVEVYYLESRPELDEGPFLTQERDLIDGIANALAEGIERRLAEEGQQRLAAVVQHSSDAVTVQDLEGSITAWNQGAEAMYGWSEPEALGMNMRDMMPGELWDEFRGFVAALRRGETVDSLETRRLARDGRVITVWQAITALLDKDGIPYAIGATERDLTARKRAEEDSRASIALLSSVIESPDNILIFVLDREFKYLRFNEAHRTEMRRVYGAEIEVGQSALMHMPEDGYRRRTTLNFERVLRGERFMAVEVSGIAPSQRWHEMVFNPLLGELGVITGFTVFVTDITNRKRAEQDRRALEAKVLQAQKLESLGVLAGGIAHDFNNLLMGILGNAGLALMDLTPQAPARASVQAIEVATLRAADLAKQMLAYSGRGKFVIVHLNLQSLTEDMTHLLESSISKKAIIEFDFAADLPSIEGDATQIRQIIMNLVINASEAIGEESGVISIRTGTLDCDRSSLDETYLQDDLAEGAYAFLEVSDTGGGMKPSTLARVFDPFFSTKFTGRGLGLAAVLGIVRGHRGAIKVHSEPGQGTTFKVLFPVSSGPVTRATAPGVLHPGVLQGRTILLVDDEETIRNVTRKILERIGMRVETASDGLEAIEYFKRDPTRFDCILLDLTMPNLDGEGTFKELCSIHKDVCVVLSSGYNEQDLINRFSGKGLAGFLQKPYRPAVLSRVITAALRSHGKV